MITQSRLKEVLSYDQRTGVFRWRLSNGRRAVKGEIAGTIQAKGQRHIGIDGRYYQAHRLAWLYVHNEWPRQLDHRNLNRDDNWIENLREATNSQNSANRRGWRAQAKGVVTVRGKFRARIRVLSRLIHLGYHETEEAAAAAYIRAAETYFGEFAHA